MAGAGGYDGYDGAPGNGGFASLTLNVDKVVVDDSIKIHSAHTPSDSSYWAGINGHTEFNANTISAKNIEIIRHISKDTSNKETGITENYDESIYGGSEEYVLANAENNLSINIHAIDIDDGTKITLKNTAAKNSYGGEDKVPEFIDLDAGDYFPLRPTNGVYIGELNINDKTVTIDATYNSNFSKAEDSGGLRQTIKEKMSEELAYINKINISGENANIVFAPTTSNANGNPYTAGTIKVGSLTIDGGTLKHSTNWDNILGKASDTQLKYDDETITIGQNGAIFINDSGAAKTFTNKLSGDGDITLSGEFNISNDNSAFSGDTKISDSSKLNISNVNAVGSGAVNIGKSGELALNLQNANNDFNNIITADDNTAKITLTGRAIGLGGISSEYTGEIVVQNSEFWLGSQLHKDATLTQNGNSFVAFAYDGEVNHALPAKGRLLINSNNKITINSENAAFAGSMEVRDGATLTLKKLNSLGPAAITLKNSSTLAIGEAGEFTNKISQGASNNGAAISADLPNASDELKLSNASGFRGYIVAKKGIFDEINSPGLAPSMVNIFSDGVYKTDKDSIEALSGNGVLDINPSSGNSFNINDGNFNGTIDNTSDQLLTLEFKNLFDNTNMATPLSLKGRYNLLFNGGGLNIANDGSAAFLTKIDSPAQIKNEGSLNIASWRVTLGNNDKFNDLNPANMLAAGETMGDPNALLDPSAYGHIILDGDGDNSKITFAPSTIKVAAGKAGDLAGSFEFNKTYDLNKVVLIATDNSTSFDLNEASANGVSLTAANFADADPYDMVDFIFSDMSYCTKNKTANNCNPDPVTPPKEPDPEPEPIEPEEPEMPSEPEPEPIEPEPEPIEPSQPSVTPTLNPDNAVAPKLNNKDISKHINRVFHVASQIFDAESAVINKIQSPLAFDMSSYDSLKASPYYHLATASNDPLNAKMAAIIRGVEASKTEVFATPFYNRSKISGRDDNAQGVLAGVSLAGDSSVATLYVGYERGEYKGSSYKTDDKTVYFGASYLDYLSGDIYVRANINGYLSSADIDKFGGFSSSANNSLVGVNVNLGKEFRFDDDSFKTELGIGTERYSFGAFELGGESHKNVNFNLLHADLRAIYKKQLNPANAILASLGARYNADNGFKSDVYLSSVDYTVSVKTDVDRVYGYAEVGLEHQISNDISLSINYNFTGSENTKSHLGYLKLGYRF